MAHQPAPLNQTGNVTFRGGRCRHAEQRSVFALAGER
jgi:hypothetical protein